MNLLLAVVEAAAGAEGVEVAVRLAEAVCLVEVARLAAAHRR